MCQYKLADNNDGGMTVQYGVTATLHRKRTLWESAMARTCKPA